MLLDLSRNLFAQLDESNQEIEHSRPIRRGRLELYGDILKAVEDDKRMHGKARATRVQGQVNMAYDRFRSILDEMSRLELVSVTKGQDDKTYEVELRPKGGRYLLHYYEMKNCLPTVFP